MVKELEEEWLEDSREKPVKNVDLWKILDLEAAKREIRWCWVKGHAGYIENEECDQLATEAILKIKEDCSEEKLEAALEMFLATN